MTQYTNYLGVHSIQQRKDKLYTDIKIQNLSDRRSQSIVKEERFYHEVLNKQQRTTTTSYAHVKRNINYNN